MTFTDDCFKNYKMDALKLFGKRFLVDVLSQLESYSVRYNQFDNTTFRLGWFLGVLDRFSPTKPEDEIAIDRLIAQLQQVRDCLFGVGGLCVVGRASVIRKKI